MNEPEKVTRPQPALFVLGGRTLTPEEMAAFTGLPPAMLCEAVKRRRAPGHWVQVSPPPKGES